MIEEEGIQKEPVKAARRWLKLYENGLSVTYVWTVMVMVAEKHMMQDNPSMKISGFLGLIGGACLVAMAMPDMKKVNALTQEKISSEEIKSKEKEEKMTQENPKPMDLVNAGLKKQQWAKVWIAGALATLGLTGLFVSASGESAFGRTGLIGTAAAVGMFALAARELTKAHSLLADSVKPSSPRSSSTRKPVGPSHHV